MRPAQCSGATARTGRVDWDDLFRRFGSGVDYPVSCVWEELASAEPLWVQRVVPVTGQFVDMVDRLVWDGLFDGRVTDRDHAVEVFEQHIEHVRRTCPPERLLVFDVADGWEPLCEFLDVPVPRRPFPHLNDAKVTRRVVTAVRVPGGRGPGRARSPRKEEQG
jgi:hypothetical protein